MAKNVTTPRQPRVESAEEKQSKKFVEDMACEIAKISRQVTALLSGRIKRATVITLLTHATRLPHASVVSVVEAIEDLENKHLN